MEPQEKIKVPESFLEHGRQEAQRRELIGEWRKHLTRTQRDRLETEGAGTPFRTAIPLEVFKNLTDEERELLAAHEQAEYNRFRPLAEARSAQRRAWIGAGGEAEDFDEAWSEGFGREETIAAIAGGQDLGPASGEYASPY